MPYLGRVSFSTGHQPKISQVEWVLLNITHFPVLIPRKETTRMAPCHFKAVSRIYCQRALKVGNEASLRSWN